MKTIYLAYPIDNAQLGLRDIAAINLAKKELLDTYGVVAVYDPGDAFMVAAGSEPTSYITTVNNSALDAADGVLAWLPLGVSSIGVPMEIARAAMVGKPVAVLSSTYSWALRTEAPNLRVFEEDNEQAAIEWLTNYESPFETNEEPLPVLTTGGGMLPTRAHSDDAGLDLYVSEDTVLPWGEFVDVPCGISVELPSWSWGLLVGRSSTFRKRGIEVQTGIIDAGYRGPLYAACIWRPDPTGLGVVQMDDGKWAMGMPKLNVTKGERLAQLIIVPNGTKDVEPVPAAKLTSHSRGEAGFGSSGS